MLKAYELPDGRTLVVEPLPDEESGGLMISACADRGDPVLLASRTFSALIFPGEEPVRSNAIVAITPLPFTGEMRMATMRTIPGT